jgi:hypothetical protein
MVSRKKVVSSTRDYCLINDKAFIDFVESELTIQELKRRNHGNQF